MRLTFVRPNIVCEAPNLRVAWDFCQERKGFQKTCPSLSNNRLVQRLTPWPFSNVRFVQAVLPEGWYFFGTEMILVPIFGVSTKHHLRCDIELAS